MNKQQNTSTWALITLIILGSVGVYYWHNSPGNIRNLFSNASTSSLAQVSNATQQTADEVEYKNEKYGFSYYHSKDATIKEYDEGNGAMTIVQENKAESHGLQIFIVPYSGTTISDERFHRDVPSGVRTNVENTYIGEVRVPAVTFNSHDDFLGDTREVWFIYRGYLYEVTTLASMDDWIFPILKTWRFI